VIEWRYQIELRDSYLETDEHLGEAGNSKVPPASTFEEVYVWRIKINPHLNY
jgi:hypothetical protein